MKKLIIIFILFSNTLISQNSYLTLWNKYYDECSRIVLDTLFEIGVVNYELELIKGNVKLTVTWHSISCPEYKEKSEKPLNYNNFLSDTVILEYIPETEHNFTFSIERIKVCKIKLRRPTKDDFWKWLKEKGFRK